MYSFARRRISLRPLTCVVLLFALSTIMSTNMTGVSTQAAEPDGVTVAWPEFRGPTEQGHATALKLPMQWAENLNVKWKTPIHGEGWSTPVVLGNQVWLTTATKDGKKMSAICVNRQTGAVLFDKVLFQPKKIEPLSNPINRYASPSPVIEEGFVYINFGSYGTTCLETKTFKPIWTRTDLPCQHFRGPGSSPFLYKNMLILTMDGVDVQYVVALDKKTGKQIWRTDRTTDFGDVQPDGKPRAGGDFRKAYCTPIVVDTKQGPQLIIPGAKAAYAYHPDTGKEIWKLRYKGYSNASRTVWADGVAYINTGYGKPDLVAIKTDGTGDVTVDKTRRLWTVKRNIPKRSSPVLVDGFLYMNDDGGVAHCIEAKTGKTVWTQRLGGQFSASPICVTVSDKKRVYFFGENGTTTIVSPGRKFTVIGKGKLDAGFMACPAVANNALYLRTKTHLYRIEN